MSFLRVLHQVAICARAESREVETDTRTDLSLVREEWNRYEASVAEKKDLLEKHCPSPDPGNSNEADGEDARSFFTSRLASKQKDDVGVSGVVFSSSESPLISKEDGSFHLGEVERMALEARLDRQHVSASLANDTFEAALPLIASSLLQESILALQVCHDSLLALSSSTSSIEIDLRVIEEVGQGLREGRVEPVRKESPKILPAVAILWPSLMSGLKDPRLPVVEKSLEVLGVAVAVGGGDFLSNRFKTQGLPALLSLLKNGPSTLRSSDHPSLLELRGGDGTGLRLGSKGGDEALAADAVMRVRASVLDCLTSFASSPPSPTSFSFDPLTPPKDEGQPPPKTSRVMQGMAWDLAAAALPHLYLNETDVADKAKGEVMHGEGRWRGRVGMAAVRLVLSAAKLDPDAIWLMMHDLLLHSDALQGPNEMPRLKGSSGSSSSMWPVSSSMREDEYVVMAARYVMMQVESIRVCP